MIENFFLNFRQNFNRILCFHTVSDKFLNIERFESFINLCRIYKINIISINDILRTPKGRNIAISFDDGYKDNVDVLLPFLIKHGITATMFVATGQLNKKAGDGSLRDNLMYDLATCNKEDLIAWQDAGMDIGYHTLTHINLYENDNLAIEKNFLEGDVIFNTLNKNNYKYFAYPFGYLPKDRFFFEKLLKNNDYECAFTISWRDVDMKLPYYLGRVCIGDYDSPMKILCKAIGLLDFYNYLRRENEKTRL